MQYPQNPDHPLLHSHQGLESLAEEPELWHAKSLAGQRERSESDLREGRVTTWAEVNQAPCGGREGASRPR